MNPGKTAWRLSKRVNLDDPAHHAEFTLLELTDHLRRFGVTVESMPDRCGVSYVFREYDGTGETKRRYCLATTAPRAAAEALAFDDDLCDEPLVRALITAHCHLYFALNKETEDAAV